MILLSVNAVSIGIRRGDYVKLGNIVCGMEYYKKSINLMNKKIDRPIYYIFSDDIEWCKKNMPSEFSFSNAKNQYEDMCMMSMCDTHVIANSSFSWWAAYLNKNTDKKVIAPLKWFQEKRINKIYKDSENYMKFKAPEDWLLI